MGNIGAASRRVARLSSRGRGRDEKIREGTSVLRWLWGLKLMTLQGNPRRSAAKGNGAATVKGSRVSNAAPTGGRPEHFEMVTAIPSLSNIFLHDGQGVEKSGESGRADVPAGGGKCGSIWGLVL
jgi:hypothetical protein